MSRYQITSAPMLGPKQPSLLDRAKQEALSQGANYALNAALPGGGVLATSARKVLGLNQGGMAYNPVNDPRRQIGDALAAQGGLGSQLTGSLTLNDGGQVPWYRAFLGSGGAGQAYDAIDERKRQLAEQAKAIRGYNDGGKAEEPKWYDLVGHFEERNKKLTGKDKEDRKASFRNEGGKMMDEDTVINGKFMSDHVPHLKKQGVKVGPLAKAVYKNEGGAVREVHYHNPMMAKPAAPAGDKK